MSGLSQCIKKRNTVSRIFNGQDVIGIAYESEDTNVCYDDPKNRKPVDKYGAVPGVIFLLYFYIIILYLFNIINIFDFF